MKSKKQFSIETDTAIIPSLVADQVCAEFQQSGTVLTNRAASVESLTLRASVIYQNNASFRKTIRSRGNKGRDALYAFMRHWLTAMLQGSEEISL